jgi:single-stranded DNA-binding protein
VADTKITHLTGNAGDDPKEYPAGDTKTLKISLAVTMRYGEEKETRWVNCTIWADKQGDLFDWAKENVSKGTPLAIEGTLKSDRYYEGKQQFDLRVVRIGLIQWAKRANGGERAPQPKASEPSTSSELDW